MLLIPFIDIIIDLLTVQPEVLLSISNGLRLNNIRFLASAVKIPSWNYPVDEIRMRSATSGLPVALQRKGEHPL